MLFRVNDSSHTVDSKAPTGKFQVTNQRGSIQSNNPLMMNYSRNGDIGVSFNDEQREGSKMNNSLAHADINPKQVRLSNVSGSHRHQSAQGSGTQQPRPGPTNSNSQSRYYDQAEYFADKDPEYRQSIAAESNREVRDSNTESYRRFSMGSTNRGEQTNNLGDRQRIELSNNNLNTNSQHSNRILNGPNMNAYSKSDKNMAEARRREQDIYPTYTNATGSKQFIKLKETSQQQMPPLPYDIDAEEAEVKSKHLEEDLLNSNAKANNELIFTQKKNTSLNMQLSNPRQPTLKESQHRYSLFRDNVQQPELKETRDSASHSNNPLFRITDDRQRQGGNQHNERPQEYEDYPYDSRMDQYTGMSALPTPEQTIGQVSGRGPAYNKQRSHSVDHNVFSNNFGNLNFKQLSKPVEARAQVATRPNDAPVQLVPTNQELLDADYKALYEEELRKARNLEDDLAKANDRIKQLKTEKVTLIQNYEKLIRKLHSVKQVESEYTKAMIEKAKLEDEVSHLEGRVTKVKNGTITDSIMESLRYPVSYSNKDKKTNQEHPPSMQHEQPAQPRFHPKSMEMGTQMSTAYESPQNNFSNVQRTSIYQQNATGMNSRAAIENERPVRSQSMAEVKHTTGRIVRDLDGYINTLESNVCEVILNGQLVYEKEDPAAPNKKPSGQVYRNNGEYGGY